MLSGDKNAAGIVILVFKRKEKKRQERFYLSSGSVCSGQRL